jgi:hypothetical protein
MNKALFYLIGFSLLTFSFTNVKTTSSKVSYNVHIKSFMDHYCVSCHGPSNQPNYYSSGDFSNYDSLKVIALNGKLRDRVIVRKDMPQSGGWRVAPRLDSTTLVMLDSWISAGAPLD